MKTPALAPLWVTLTQHARHLLEAEGADAVLIDNATKDAVRGRTVIVVASAAKPGREVHAERKLRGTGTAAIVATVTPELLRPSGASDTADLIETAKANGVAPKLDLLAALAVEKVRAAIAPVHRGLETVPPVAPVGGAELLDAVHSFLGRFVAYPSDNTRVAHTLWIAHTHLMDAWESTPRIAFLSPEPGSGKTRALEITETLVPRPIEAINVTPAYLFRKVSDPAGAPTVLYDEIDTLFGPKAKDNEEIRGILNAGHRRGAMAGRCVMHGKIVTTEELPAYCAVALAGLGRLPDTIISRSVVVRMRRRLPTETVEPYRRRIHGPEGNALRDKLASWAASVKNTISTTPTMPTGIEDRNADVWEALLAVAEAAGGGWSRRARVTAVTLVTETMAASPSLGIRLLADLRLVFCEREAMFTRDIIEALCNLDEAPWADIKGKPIDARRISRYLDDYGVAPQQVRIREKVGKGYTREALHDPWARYLKSVTSVTKVTDCPAKGTNEGDL